MKTRSFCLAIAAMLVMVFPMSCNNGGERPEGVEEEKREPLTGWARCINTCFNTQIL